MKNIIFILLLIFVTLFGSISGVLAQNYQRQEEEGIKDQERAQKYKEFIEQKKIEEEELLKKPLTEEEIREKKLVEVESNNILPSELSTVQALVPYKIRRPRWGHLFTITYSQYNPINYQSDYESLANYEADGGFEGVYGSASAPLLEFSYAYKWNINIGSIAGEFSYGSYRNENDIEATYGDAELSLQIIRLGVRYNIDNIALEPKVVPYGIAGIYTVLYEETQANSTFDGTTGMAFYYGGGLMLQLGWLDPVASVDAYTESGIENTYVFAEARQFLSSDQGNDPDFSTGLDLNFGLNIEF